jgi:hypothetical protein
LLGVLPLQCLDLLLHFQCSTGSSGCDSHMHVPKDSLRLCNAQASLNAYGLRKDRAVASSGRPSGGAGRTLQLQIWYHVPMAAPRNQSLFAGPIGTGRAGILWCMHRLYIGQEQAPLQSFCKMEYVEPGWRLFTFLSVLYTFTHLYVLPDTTRGHSATSLFICKLQSCIFL